ncbi:uncharacterized protein LOC126656718 [Mercurialis annua]|uniref:uncharacterized protein LOC126656718 n=1 Tax=Mercurialis annua TaxID=3986 RepID=UPI0021609B3B|nr:uncharacterized protein LOC126656718 [Mercurialis annua]
MGFLEQEKACKDHPYHNQKQGVCPCCLREKLAQIYSVATATQACSSCSSISSSATNLSPPHHRLHQRTASDFKGSISFKVSSNNITVGSNKHGLKKSKSVAFVTRNLVGDAKNKKKGFWSKLLHLKAKSGNKDVNFDAKIALNGLS